MNNQQTIIITGASEGIGAALAQQMSRPGINLMLAARSGDKLQKVADQCKQLGANAMIQITDVSIQGDCIHLVERTITEFGGLDILINNAGVSMHAKFSEISDLTVFEKLFRINTMSAVWTSHAALPYLRQSKGQIVAISSLAGKTGIPERTTYCTSKFAMSGFFEALRIELVDSGVNVFTACPGVVATEIRRNGWNAQGQRAGVSGLKEEAAMSVTECAQLIAKGIAQRDRELIMTTKGKIGLKLKAFFPTLVDNMARAALKK
jgi:short-subunit dehydrogenase